MPCRGGRFAGYIIRGNCLKRLWETVREPGELGVVELQVTIEHGAEVLIEPVPPGLVSQITGRKRSLFHADMEKNRRALAQACSCARVLVIGAAGSIGSAVVKLLALLEPAALVLVDMNENSLADLVRALRAGTYRLPQDFATSVAMFGTPGFERFLRAAGPFQVMFNFAALKHVRSERDPFSLMRMIETNVFAVEDLGRSAASRGARLFSVSSDKAVFPSSLMGATKRWMERVLAESSNAACASARFANVAFSNGSLLHAILERLEQRQPVAAPDNIRRYFISHTEAAELCLLAGFLGRSAEIFVPRLDPMRDSLLLDEAVRRVLAFRGLEAVPCARKLCRGAGLAFSLHPTPAVKKTTKSSFMPMKRSTHLGSTRSTSCGPIRRRMGASRRHAKRSKPSRARTIGRRPVSLMRSDVPYRRCDISSSIGHST